MNDHVKELIQQWEDGCGLRKVDFEDIARATIDENDKLREACKYIEWGGSYNTGGPTCPACFRNREPGHAPGCILAAALKEKRR